MAYSYSESKRHRKFLGGRKLIRAARWLLVAYDIQRVLDRKPELNRAQIARASKVSKCWITLLLNLLKLAPDVQKELLSMEKREGRRDPITENNIRWVYRAKDWEAQRKRWQLMLKLKNN